MCLNIYIKKSFLKSHESYGILFRYVNHSHFEAYAEKELKEERHHNQKKEKGNEITMSWKKRNKKEGERKRHRECKPKQPRATKR